MKKHEQNLWEKLCLILNNNDKTNPRFLIAQEIIFRINFNKPLNISEIAKKTYVSKPTITRFAQSFGFEGFKEFAQELFLEEKKYYFLTDVKSPEESYHSYNTILQDLFSSIDGQLNTLIKITEKIKDYKLIYIFTSSENVSIGNVFSQKLQYLGFNVRVSYNNKNVMLWNSVKKDDLVFFLVSGYDMYTLAQIWDHLNSLTTTILISTISQLEKFPNPNILVKLEINSVVLYDQAKAMLFSYTLDQIFNILVNSNKKFLDTFMLPNYRI